MNNKLQIIKKYNLTKELNYIVQNNNSNFAPYHNLNHMLSVMESCYELHQLIFGDTDQENLELLLKAAIWHDYNHSQGKFTDDYNIPKALISAKEFYSLTGLHHSEIDVILQLIEITSYPYKDKINTIYEKIIRDADLSMMAKDDYLFYIIGLYEENKNSKQPLDFKSIILNCIEFNSNIKFNLQLSENLYYNKICTNLANLIPIIENGL